MSTTEPATTPRPAPARIWHLRDVARVAAVVVFVLVVGYQIGQWLGVDPHSALRGLAVVIAIPVLVYLVWASTPLTPSQLAIPCCGCGAKAGEPCTEGCR